MNTSSPETENFVYRPPHENLNAATQWRWTRWTRLAFKTLIQQSSCKSNMFHGFSWIHHDSPLEQHWNIGNICTAVSKEYMILNWMGINGQQFFHIYSGCSSNCDDCSSGLTRKEREREVDGDEVSHS
jgi:hypothetical protein